jgi:hypothetical protein
MHLEIPLESPWVTSGERNKGGIRVEGKLELRRSVSAKTAPPAPPAWVKRGVLHCAAKAIKTTIVLPGDQFAGLAAPMAPHLQFAIAIGGGAETALRGTFNGSSMRKTLATIAENGAADTLVIVQGTLLGNQLDAAGISAQLKPR